VQLDSKFLRKVTALFAKAACVFSILVYDWDNLALSALCIDNVSVFDNLVRTTSLVIIYKLTHYKHSLRQSDWSRYSSL